MLSVSSLTCCWLEGCNLRGGGFQANRAFSSSRVFVGVVDMFLSREQELLPGVRGLKLYLICKTDVDDQIQGENQSFNGRYPD